MQTAGCLSLLSLSAWLVFRAVLASKRCASLRKVSISPPFVVGSIGPGRILPRHTWSRDRDGPGIAVYRGASCLTIGKAQFPDLGSAARYVEARVRSDALRSSWPAG